MTVVQRDIQHGTDVLIRKVEGHLLNLRAGLGDSGLAVAELLGDRLRELVVQTAQASAADRARVRVAVHYFVLTRAGRGELVPARALATVLRLINRVARELDRPDLVVEPGQ